MPELDPVTQDITANATEWLATFDEMITKAQEFATIAQEIENKLLGIAEDANLAANALDGVAEAADAAARAAAAVGTAATQAASGLKDLAGEATAAAGSDRLLAGALSSLDESLQQLITLSYSANSQLSDMRTLLAEVATSSGLSASALDRLDSQIAATIGSLAALSAAEKAASDSGGGGGGGGGFLSSQFLATAMTWGQALHWIVMGTLEIAATAVPALVALGAAFVAMYPTVDGLVDRYNQLMTATGGLSNALHAVGGPLGSLSSSMGKVSAAVQPDVWIILGSAIEAVTNKTGAFAGMATQASTVLANFSQKIVSDLQGQAGSAIVGFFSNAVRYMTQWGQFLGNLGHTFLNVVSGMFGVGQLLLDALDGISIALRVITSNPIAQWLIGLAAAMSAAYRYGLLLQKIWTWLGGSALVSGIQALVAKMQLAVAETGDWSAAVTVLKGEFMALVTSTGFMVFAVGIAAGLAIWYLATRHVNDATTQLIASIEKAPATVGNLSTGIVVLNDALDKAQQKAKALEITAANNGTSLQVLGNKANGAGTNIEALAARTGVFQARAQAAQGDVKALETAITSENNKLIALQVTLATLTPTQAAVGASMNVLSIQTGLQDSKVQALNQAWDQYIGLMTGGMSSLANFTTGLQNMLSVSATSGLQNLSQQTKTVTLNVQGFQKALAQGPTGSLGAGAWQNFSQMLNSQVSSLNDWGQTAMSAGAITKGQFANAIADTVAQMAQFTGVSGPAADILLAIAQRSGLDYTSLQQLVQGQGGATNAQKQLNDIVTKGTIAMTDASKIATNMSSVLNTQVTNAIAAAALKASGFTTDISNMMQAEETHTTVAGHTWQQWQSMAQSALNNAKQTATSDAQSINQSLNSIPNITTKYVDIVVNQITGSTIASTAGTGGQKVGGVTIKSAGGGYIHGPGTATSDSIPAMLSHGEYVMQASSVEKYGRAMFDALNARKYAQGGPVTGAMPGMLTAAISGGEGGVVNVASNISLSVGGNRLSTFQRRESLTYTRRNPQNNLSLRVR